MSNPYHCLQCFFSVSPLLQVAFLSMFLIPEQSSISKFALAIGTVRALRQVKIHSSTVKLTVRNELVRMMVSCKQGKHFLYTWFVSQQHNGMPVAAVVRMFYMKLS